MQADFSSSKTLSKQQVSDVTYTQNFSVTYEFPVVFTEDIFNPNNPTIRDALCRIEPMQRHRCLVFVDQGLADAQQELLDRIKQYAKHHEASIELVRDPIIVPGGEKIKSTLHFVEDMQRALSDYHIDRHSFTIAIGGGAVLDAVGLVSAVTHRGVRHIRIPTTVLSQNDSGVGVKNAVNQFGQKNFVGTFAPPFAVLNDLNFALSLGERDKIAGMAEAVKVALIRDRTFYEWLEHNSDHLAIFDRDAMAKMIRRCAELHMRQIGQGGDPFEAGSARPLDFGHWSAHKLEGLTNYHVRHGEAVAIGIALDTRYSVLKGLLEPGLDERVCVLLEHIGFRLWHPVLGKTDANGNLTIVEGLREFREHLGGELTITLLQDLGRGIELHEMDTGLVREAIAWLKGRQEP
ncbi:MAG: 3-dehydroquinate synthase [Hyphomicrobiaceae bacterium]